MIQGFWYWKQTNQKEAKLRQRSTYGENRGDKRRKKTINKHIEIKQRCVDQKVVDMERKFDLCDMITGEIQQLQSKRKQLEGELCLFQKKEWQAEWYQRKKQMYPISSDSEHNMTSPGSGLLSPGSSHGSFSPSLQCVAIVH